MDNKPIFSLYRSKLSGTCHICSPAQEESSSVRSACGRDVDLEEYELLEIQNNLQLCKSCLRSLNSHTRRMKDYSAACESFLTTLQQHSKEFCLARDESSAQDMFEHIYVFSNLDEISPSVLVWLEDYKMRKPEKFKSLSFVKQISQFQIELGYRGSSKKYNALLKEYYGSSEWHEKSRAVFKRDNFRCILCGGVEALTVHHKTYENFGNESLEDLITLCRKCYTAVHRKPAW